MIFTLPNSNVKGHQLADEIIKATGIDVVNRYSRIGETLDFVINGEDIEANATTIQAVIDAHVPDPLYFAEDIEMANRISAKEEITTSGVAGKTPEEIREYLTAQMTEGGWAQIPVDVRQDLGKWLIMLASNIVWK